MGDAQSAQRESRKDAANEEESGKVDDAKTEENTEDKPFKNNGQISEINGKADGSIAEVNCHCEDEIAAEAIISSDEEVSETEKALKEDETPLENVEMDEKQSPNEDDADNDVPLEMIEMDAKQNDINESFKKFFSNIGLKLTVKRGSSEMPTDVPGESNQGEPNRPEDIEDNAKETKSENAEQSTDAEQNTDGNIAQETYDNDSTTCPTLTDITSEDVLENAEQTTETKEEVESGNTDAATALPVVEAKNQDATPKEKPHSTFPSSTEKEVVESPIKRFFTTGIFSGLRKKTKPLEDENTEKELVDMGKKEVIEATKQTVQNQEQISQGVETVAVVTEPKENEFKEAILSAVLTTEERKSPAMDTSTIIVTESEIMSSQEKDKVQASPLKRLLSGSSLKKLSKKQRSRKSSDAKLSDSGEHVSDQLLSSTESAEHQKEESPAQPSTEAAGEEDGAWASFKKLVTPIKRMKRSSLSNEETQIPGPVEELKPSEGEQISDHSTEEGKKRKDSSVSWEAVLCGSGRRRSRKTSDSEDETPRIDNNDNKQDSDSKHGAESSNENENYILASSPKQARSPSEGDGGSTWKSLKRLVATKRNAKDEDESKDNVQSDSEVTQDESSFSIKKLLVGRKKRKSAEKQDQVSSDEADKDVASGDEDSDTPAVVPLSEFDIVETEVHIQIQADVESQIPEEADYELQQDLLDQMAEPVLPCSSLQTETKKVKDNDDALEKQCTTTLATNKEPDDLTESISNHQQLSDIPEEGIITETMATPASVTEDAARDDTMAEDLIEITSEAVTAPEPASDIPLADETEMISAVSQLSSESSKTSGNTTPVPAEYDVIETDVLLHQVVGTISISPKAVPEWSDELSSERIVGSVSHQILERFVKEEPTILEIHKKLDSNSINAGLNVEELDAICELVATAQTESISEVNDSVSTEIVSEVATEEFDTAEIAEDEVHVANVTHPEESIKELESIDESYDLVECLSGLNAAVSTDLLPESEDIVPDKGSLVEAQCKTEPAIYSEEADSAATVAEKTKNGAMEQEVQTLTEKEDQIMHNITDQVQVEDKDQPPVEVEELQELAAVQAAALNSEKRVQSLEKEAISEDIALSETVTYEPKEETAPLTEVNVDPDKEDELETDAAKTEHVQEPEELEGSVQSPEEEVNSKAIPQAETVTGESKEETIPLIEVCVEQVDASNTEHVEVPEELEGSVQSLEKEVISANITEAETFTGESKEETIPLIEVSVEQVDASNTEHVQEPEELEGSVQSPEEEVKSEDIPPAETVTDEPKQTAEHLSEVSVERENKELPINAVKSEHVQVPEELEGSVQSLEKEVISANIAEAETVTDEPQQTAEHLSEVSVEPVQEPKVLEAVQAPTLNSEDGSVHSLEKEVISANIAEAETVTGESKKETIPLIEVSVEQVDASNTEHVQETEVSQAVNTEHVQVPEELEGSVQSPEEEVKSEDIPPAEIITDESKEETIPLIEVSLEQVDASNTEHVQVPEKLKCSVQSPEKEVKSEDIPPAEIITDEPKQTVEHLSEVSVEPENKELPVNAVKTEHVQVPEELEGSVQSSEEEVKSEDIPPAETVTDESKEETIPLNEVILEPVDASNTEHVLVSEELEGSVKSLEKEVISANIVEAETVRGESKEETIPLVEICLEQVNASNTEHVQEPEELEGSVQSPEEEVKSEDIPPAETVTDEPKQTAEHLSEVSVERENKELPINAVKCEHVQVPEELEGSVQSLEKEVISANIAEAETVTGESKEETIPLIEVSVEQVDASNTEHVQVPEELEGSVQSPEEEVKSEEIPPAEIITDEPKQTAEHLSEVSVEPENKELPVNAVKTEHVQVPEELEGSVQSLEKEVISANIAEAETVTDEPQQTAEHLSEVSVEPVQEPKVLEAVQAPTLNSEDGSVHSLEKEVISANIAKAETVTGESKEETIPLIEVSLQPVDASNTEHVQEPEVSQAVNTEHVQVPEELEGSVQSPEEEVKSEDILPAEIITDESKQTAEHLSEVSVEPENKELLMNAVKSEHVQVPEELEGSVQSPEEEVKSEVVQSAMLDLEDGSLLSLEKEVRSEDIPAVETVTDVSRHEIEVKVQPEEKLPMEAAKTVQEPEVLPSDVEDSVTETRTEEGALMYVHIVTESIERGSAQELEKQILLKDVPKPDTDNVITSVTDQIESIVVAQLDQALKITGDHKTERIPQDVDQEDCITEDVHEIQTLTVVHVSSISEEARHVQVLEKTVISEETLAPSVDNAAVTDEPKHEVHLSSVQVSVEGEKESEICEITEIKTATLEHDVVAQVVTCNLKEVSVAIPDILIEKTTDTIEPLTDRVERNIQVQEKTVISEEILSPSVDNAAVTDEPKHELHLSTVQVSVEGEKESEICEITEIKTAAPEHAVVSQVVTCNLKEVSVAIPKVLIEKTTDTTEPLTDRVASKLMFKKEDDTATPLVKGDVTETAKEGSVVVIMHVPSVKFEDNHRIQVQVVKVNIKSAETTMDSALEVGVGVTEAQEVINVCLETGKKVDTLSATPEIEEEIINEENTLTIQEVSQHVKENLSATVPEPVVVILEQEVIKQSDAVTEVSELVESESKDQRAIEDSIENFKERQDEAPDVISDDSAERQVSEDLMQTADIPGSLNVSFHDHKEDLEETQAEQEKSVGVTAEEVKSLSEELKIYEQAQIPQIAQSLTVAPTNTGLIVPQNTGIISSIGNLESPSSLSLEFKLNIQFGQAQAPASLPPTTERIEPVKQTDVSVVGLQKVEAVEHVKPTQRAESRKQTELTEVAVQVTEITEPAANVHSTERAANATQPALRDVGIQAIKTVEPVEQITSTEGVTASDHATETIQPVRPTEIRVFLSPPIISEACNQETKAEEPVKQKEEENDQDVWMDAEEVIYPEKETEVSLLEVEKSLEPPKNIQEEKAGLEYEVEMASNSKAVEEESQQGIHKTGGMCDNESEGEDFAVAPEHPETATSSITGLEWD